MNLKPRLDMEKTLAPKQTGACSFCRLGTVPGFQHTLAASPRMTACHTAGFQEPRRTSPGHRWLVCESCLQFQHLTVWMIDGCVGKTVLHLSRWTWKQINQAQLLKKNHMNHTIAAITEFEKKESTQNPSIPINNYFIFSLFTCSIRSNVFSKCIEQNVVETLNEWMH